MGVQIPPMGRGTFEGDEVGIFQHASSYRATGFASWLRLTDVAPGTSTKLCMMFGRLLVWYTIYKFWRLLPPNGILPGAKFTLRPSLAFFYIGSAA